MENFPFCRCGLHFMSICEQPRMLGGTGVNPSFRHFRLLLFIKRKLDCNFSKLVFFSFSVCESYTDTSCFTSDLTKFCKVKWRHQQNKAFGSSVWHRLILQYGMTRNGLALAWPCPQDIKVHYKFAQSTVRAWN